MKLSNNNSGGTINNNSGGTINNTFFGTITTNSGSTINNSGKIANVGTINNSGTIYKKCGSVITGVVIGNQPIPICSIILFPTTAGPIGKTVKVNGTGYAASSTITITYDGVAQTTTPVIIIAKATGSFSATFTVPASTAGPHTVRATGSDASTDTASKSFKVIPVITLSSANGTVGKTVTVKGTSFAPNSTVTITFDGVSQATLPATITSDTTGSFIVKFKIPASTVGSHTITTTDASANSARKLFDVT